MATSASAADEGCAPCEGIRPGAPLLNGCTMGWVLQDAEGAWYVLTAGHCASLGGTVSVDGLGDVGTTVVRRAAGPGDDFALVRVRDDLALHVSPTMCAFGGPLRAAPHPAPGVVYRYYGWGDDVREREETRARTGPELAPPATFLAWQGVVSPGDSGAPVMSAAGLAMGIVTHSLDLGPAAGPSLSGGVGTPVAHIIAVSRAEGHDVRLAPGGPLVLDATREAPRSLVEAAGGALVLVVAPLYVRVHGHDALHHPLRRRLHAAIAESPGIGLLRICEMTNSAEGTVRYHLKVLVSRGIVREQFLGGMTGYGLAGMDSERAEAGMAARHLHAVAISRVVARSPGGLTLREIVLQTGISPGAAYHHVTRLVSWGRLRVERRSRALRYLCDGST